MNAPDNPNAALEEELIDIIREAVTRGLPEDEAKVLCYGCGIDSKQVLDGNAA